MRTVSAVFSKELVTIARSKGHYFARAFFLGLLTAVIWASWQMISGQLGGAAGADLAYFGHELFIYFSIAQIAIVILMVPALTAPIVAAEKERDTLSLLLMTNLGNRHILLDKLLSRLAVLGLLLLAVLPLLLCMLAFGGIELEQIVALYITVFSIAFLCCAIGLWVSTRATSTRSALIGTYLTLVGYVAIALFIQLVWYLTQLPDLLSYVNGRSEWYEVWPLFTLLPGGMLKGMMEDGGISLLACPPFLIFSALLFFLSVVYCAYILPKAAAAKRTSRLKNLLVRLNKFFRSINYGGVTFLRDTVQLESNPLFWLELHRRFACSRVLQLRVTYLMLIIAPWFYLFWAQAPELARALTTIHFYLMVVLVIARSSTAFAGEREHDRFDILCCTSQTAGAFVMSKFLGVVKSLLPILVIPLFLPLLGLIPYLGPTTDWPIWQGVFARIILMHITFLPPLIVVGLYFSVRCRKTNIALSLTLLTVVAWFLLVAALDLVPFPRGLALNTFIEALGFLSPIQWFHHMFISRNSFREIDVLLLPVSLTFTFVWSMALFRFIKRFDSIVGRQ